MTASKEDLIQRVHDISDPIQSFLITTDMAASVGKLYSGELTDYATIGGYILFQRPDDIRIIGQDPVIHSTLFDMVSMGKEFRVYIPVKSRFIEGNNDTPGTSRNKVENLRPAAFLNAMLIYPPDQNDSTLLEDDTDETKSVYILLIVRRRQDQLQLVRNLYFDRYTLQIVRQKTFDPSGGIASDTNYYNWKVYGDISFPSQIDIERPQDGYAVTLTIGSMKVNTAAGVTPDKFVLEQPPGSKLEELK